MSTEFSNMTYDNNYIRALHNIKSVITSVITEEDLRAGSRVWQDNQPMWQTTDDMLFENIEDAISHQIKVDTEGS